MKPANAMQKIITEIAQECQFDLTVPFAHLSLAPVYNQPLVIEKHGPHTLAVLHIASDGALDPMIRFHITAINTWLPIAEQLALFSRTNVLAYPGKEVGDWNVKRFQQRDCATFANAWAQNIRDQKWVKQMTERRFCATPDSAYLIAPDNTITKQQPLDPDDGFRLPELYHMLQCDTIEVTPLDSPDYILIGDENGKFGDYAINDIATRLSRIDEHRDEWAGRALLCPSRWLK
jgi:hypothetical protein